MNQTYRDALATHGSTLISHIALVNGSGVEVGDARKSVTWVGPTGDGLLRPNQDIEFLMQGGDQVAGWKGFSALTGGTDYGGSDLTAVTFANPGTYTMEAANTGINHVAP